MVDAVRHWSAVAGDDPALTVDERTLSFRELDLMTETAGHELLRLGVVQGDRVTLALPNSVEFIVAAIAILKVGAAIAPLSHRLPLIERQALIDLTEPSLVIGVDPADHPGKRCVRQLDISPTADAPRLPTVVSETWKITTSGGTSGRPKLIITTTPALIDLDAKPDYLLPKRGVVLIPGPLYHTAPFAQSLLAIFHGCHVIIESRFDAQLTMELLERHKVNFVLLVPTMMNRIWKLPAVQRDRDLSALTTVFHMAARCPVWLKQAWIDWLGPERIFELYGASDSPANAIISGSEWLAHPGSVGRPALGEMCIRDHDGNTLPPKEIGEIWMRPPIGVQSRARVVGADQPHDDGWTTVGDLGWMDDDGYVYIADRRSDMIITGGENVFAAEVEAALERHAGVLSSAVVGLPDDDLGQRVHAIVEVADGVTEEDLRSHMEQHLARYKTPRTYELTNNALRDDAGKIRKSDLISSYVDSQS
ncbi:o-succinylbenzoate--CoA ligase [Mycolicibacterium rhodesiae JS60]|nr:o-succinylbenzoate--CoA ligase [Mycolicibacterium rhodesiae JS60]